jgi:hypothetical protein
MSATPAVGDHLSREHGPEKGQAFYEIVELRDTLDGPLVVARLDEAAAAHHGHSEIQLKASDLRAAGTIAGATIWTC